jgi:hypothetical protein
MNDSQKYSRHSRVGAALRGLAITATLGMALFTTELPAQAPAAAPTAALDLSAQQLEQLVGPIALYPDDLIGIILPASTNPLQLVQADRYLEKRKADPKLPVDEKWDDAVKSLLNYPEVVKKMSGDLDWTAALGEAVVADQGEVLEAIQAFRRKTQSAGNLQSDAKQVIVVEKEVIKIVPANPQVIYVPQYNPTTVVVYGGYSSWGYYASPYPVYYYPYPPGAAFATGLIWGAAISASWHGNYYVAHYGGNANININHNNININSGNINSGNINRGGGAGGGGSSQWKPGKQPGQVSRSVGTSAPNRVGDPGARSGTAMAAPRASTQPATAARSQSAGAAGGGQRASAAGGGGAFDGYGSGRQAQLNSSRGATSRGSMSGGRTRPSGGARSPSRGGIR